MMAVFAISPILYFPLTNSWLEQQRVAELLLIQIVCLFYFLKKNNFFSFFINILLLSIFAIGFISSVTAEYPLWALKEWGKSIGLFFVAFVVADYIKENKNEVTKVADLGEYGDFVKAFIINYSKTVNYNMMFYKQFLNNLIKATVDNLTAFYAVTKNG